MAKRLIPLKEVLSRVPYSRTTLWRLMRQGSFPSSIAIASRRVAWDEDEVNAHIEALAAARATGRAA